MFCYYLVTGWSQAKSDARFGISSKFWFHIMCHNPVPICFAISWSQCSHRSNLMPDSESALNFCIVPCATTQLLHVLQLAGHSWSQGRHKSNLMPDSESAQHFALNSCVTSHQFGWKPLQQALGTNWDQMEPIWDQFGNKFINLLCTNPTQFLEWKPDQRCQSICTGRTHTCTKKKWVKITKKGH